MGRSGDWKQKKILVWAYQSFFEVHELGISLDYHLRTSFVVSLHSSGHSGDRKLEQKKRIFSISFSHFFLNLLSKRLI